MSEVLIKLRVGENLDEDALLDAISSHESKISNHLIGDVRFKHDPRATYNEGSLRFRNVACSSGKYSLTYDYSWTAYYGCRDMNCGGNEDTEIDFEYNGKEVIFRFPDILFDEDPNEEPPEEF